MMKRYLCAVAAGLLLALMSAGSATASGLPILGGTQDGSQKTSFGDQTVGEQKNDADIEQKQGNYNLNVAPAIALFGDASTWNAQGNGNTAVAGVSQSNSASQSQSSEQTQTLDQSGSGGHCCAGQDQTGEQKVYGGDQTVEKQKNDADIEQKQGNGNVNIAPAVAIFGDASTKNAQGNGNTAIAGVSQSNSATQTQDASQTQNLGQSGGGSCCGGQSQSGEQKVYGGDQTVEKQKNDADITQKQGNGNVNIAPAVAIFGDASTWNAQGNGNTAVAGVRQTNTATQSQSASQTQSLDQSGGGSSWSGKWDKCCGGQSQTGEQKVRFGDQTVGEQKNDADIEQKQGNGNVNFSPAVGLFGDASTKNAQGNGNTAVAGVSQSNTATQSQSSTQAQDLKQDGGGWVGPPQDCWSWSKCGPPHHAKPHHAKPHHAKPHHGKPEHPRCDSGCEKPPHPDCRKPEWHHWKCPPVKPAPDREDCKKGDRLLA